MRLPMGGGCQCGAVRYEITAEPSTVYVCHCTDCHKQSSSAFALSMIVPRDAIRVTSGEAALWVRPGAVTASGTPTDCFFCRDCGVRLYHWPSRNTAIAVVKPGTLDDTSWLQPIGHIWTGSAQPWVAIPAETVNYEGQPPDFKALEAAWRARRRAQS